MTIRIFAVLAAVLLVGQVQARTILFIGNSFTFGGGSPVRRYRPDLVTDLNGDGIGGVPALFKRFADQAGLDWKVSLETSPGKPLSFHLAEKADRIRGAWDVVVLQGYSTLDPQNPGDPQRHILAAGQLAQSFRRANGAAQIHLVTTWARPDQVYRRGGRWFGTSMAAMTDALASANMQAKRQYPELGQTMPVGPAFMRATAKGLADANPYDGIAFGQVGLWTWDQYHASAEGYYLEALVIFGGVTGIDPRSLGANEQAADDLGLSPAVALSLQAIAAEELVAGRIIRPAPAFAR